jgi:hypothetical protein
MSTQPSAEGIVPLLGCTISEVVMMRCAVLLLAVAQSIRADTPKDSSAVKELERLKVPVKLIPKKGQPLFLLRAEGVQIYKGMETDGNLQWVLDAPNAVLLDYDTGEKVGTHSRGPVWEETDGSKVKGDRLAAEKAPNPSAIDWLLLKGAGDGGKGRFGEVTFIARIDTWAGRAPATKPDKAGAVKEVRYQATYIFYGPRK